MIWRDNQSFYCIYHHNLLCRGLVYCTRTLFETRMLRQNKTDRTFLSLQQMSDYMASIMDMMNYAKSSQNSQSNVLDRMQEVAKRDRRPYRSRSGRSKSRANMKLTLSPLKYNFFFLSRYRLSIMTCVCVSLSLIMTCLFLLGGGGRCRGATLHKIYQELKGGSATVTVPHCYTYLTLVIYLQSRKGLTADNKACIV